MTNGEAIVQLIDTAAKRDEDDELRTHLGASVIGKECLREIWLGFRWAAKKSFPGRMLRLFARGHREELVFADLFRSIGATVHIADANGNQFRVSACGGHFGGSMDAAIYGAPYVPTAWAIGEFKTHSDKQFTRLTKEGVEKSHPHHYMQATVYGFLAGLPYAIYCGSNKNDDNLHLEVFPVLPYVGQRAIAKADTIIFSQQSPPKIANDASNYKCRFCDMRNVCHGYQMPLVNCRTCVHAAPSRAGGWTCGLGQAAIHSAPRVGCAGHVFNPYLFPHATPVAGNLCFDANFITYQTRRGQITNGPAATPSASLDLTLQ